MSRIQTPLETSQISRWSPGTPLPAPATASKSDLRGNRAETAWNDRQHHLNVAARDPAPETRDSRPRRQTDEEGDALAMTPC